MSDPVEDFIREQRASSGRSRALRCLRARKGEATKRTKEHRELKRLVRRMQNILIRAGAKKKRPRSFVAGSLCY